MIDQILKFFKRSFRKKELLDELLSYSDRDLLDMGVCRYDINNIVEKALKNEGF